MTEELPHIRCIECGKVLANKWGYYQDMLAEGVPIKDALTKLGLTRPCCRYRMMNPFKVPTRSNRQIDPRDTGFERQVEILNVATGYSAPVLEPLQAMEFRRDDQTTNKQTNDQTEITPAYTVVPTTDRPQIALPDIPQVNLPGIPAPGAEMTPETPGYVIRTYQAW